MIELLHAAFAHSSCQTLSTTLAFVYRDFFEDQWQNLNDNLFSQAPDVFPQASFSYARFLWAVATLRAHVHAPLQGAQVALVPLADLVSNLFFQRCCSTACFHYAVCIASNALVAVLLLSNHCTLL